MAVEAVPNDLVALHTLRLEQLQERTTEVEKAKIEGTPPTLGIPGGRLLDDIRNDVLRLFRDNPVLKETLGDLSPEDYLDYLDSAHGTADELERGPFVCPVSMERLIDPTVVDSCEHVFNRANLEDWFTRSTTCPECRVAIGSVAYAFDVEKRILSAAMAVLNEVRRKVTESESEMENESLQQQYLRLADSVQAYERQIRTLEETAELQRQQKEQQDANLAFARIMQPSFYIPPEPELLVMS